MDALRFLANFGKGQDNKIHRLHVYQTTDRSELPEEHREIAKPSLCGKGLVIDEPIENPTPDEIARAARPIPPDEFKRDAS